MIKQVRRIELRRLPVAGDQLAMTLIKNAQLEPSSNAPVVLEVRKKVEAENASVKRQKGITNAH